MLAERTLHTSIATVAHLVRANFVLRQAQQMAAEGVCLKFKKWKGMSKDTQLACVGFHDASFANQTNHGSHGARKPWSHESHEAMVADVGDVGQ